MDFHSHKEELNDITFRKMDGTGDRCAKRKTSTKHAWCVCWFVGFRGKKGLKVKGGL